MIDYEKLSQAINFYRAQGFLLTEVPWTASDKILAITMPKNAVAIKCDVGSLVGSAEQSFLQMIVDGKLPPGQYMACTPCFRNDPIDDLHQKYFMKLELIDTKDTSMERLDSIISMCKFFFEHFLPVKVIQVEDMQFDIVSEATGIELGSYGIRTNDLTGPWIYATGCAEPRLSFVLKKESSHV